MFLLHKIPSKNRLSLVVLELLPLIETKRQSSGLIYSLYKGRKSLIKPIPTYDHVVLPPLEHRKLPALEYIPKPPNNTEEMKLQRRRHDWKGPETIHNRLIYKQYGLVALCGGQISPGHISLIRESVNRHIKKNMFAVWRIDPPWKPLTKKPKAKKLGGGKGSIYTYVTPVKAGRIIFEFGGFVDYEKILKMLIGVALRMPFDAMPVHQEFYDEFKEELRQREEKNLNPLTLEYAIKNNLAGCQSYVQERDHIWYGKY